MDWSLVYLMVQSYDHQNCLLMGMQMKSLTVCFLVIDLDQQMYLSLIPTNVLHQSYPMGQLLVLHIGMTKYQQLLHMVIQRQDSQKASLMGLKMEILTVCCLVIDLDQQMYLSLIPMKLLNYAFPVGKCLVHKL